LSYLSENGFEHIEDSTNASDDYARNRLRHHVLPILWQQNSGAIANIASATELLREDEEYLLSQAESFIRENLGEDNSLPVTKLLALPQPVERRVLRSMCGSSLERGHAQAIHMLCESSSVHCSADVPGMRVSREFDRLRFGAKPVASIPERELIPGTVTEIPEAKLRIICKQIEKCPDVNKSFNTFCFKSESICGRIFVASRKDGAKIRLDGRGCTKTLKKLFMEAGMPLSQRETTPVIYDEAGVIAVYGFGAAERCRAKSGDNIIKLEVQNMDGRGQNGERYT
jgi:tRNA(Ile)-lysidine synthase